MPKLQEKQENTVNPSLTDRLMRQFERVRLEYLAIASVVLVILLSAVVQIAPAGRPGAAVRYVNVPDHASLAQVANTLHAKRLVRNPAAFKLLARLSGVEAKVKPGYYGLSPELSAWDLLQWLTSGKGRMLRFTVPEGFSVSRIARLLDSRGVGNGQKFLQLIEAPAPFVSKHPWLVELGPPSTLEGYLFPDTYLFEGTRIDEAILIDEMLKRFKAVVMKAYEQDPHAVGDFKDALILASIIELEAVRPDERAIISGVFHRRLKLGMKLGSDPTVEYALQRHQTATGLSFKDVKIDSPYNTYRYAGLPPAPIGNPGLASFNAAIHPAETPYLFFVAKGEGRHAFTRTYREHLAAVRQYRP